MKKLILFSFSYLICATLLGQIANSGKDITISLPPLPCQFSWAEVVMPNGATKNFTETRDCQPYQGPCIAFSLVKAMECKLNRQTDNNCQDLDFSFAYLDYAAFFSIDTYFDLLNSGFGIPEDGCGNFPPECNDFGPNDHCWCVDNIIQEQAIDNDLCFEINSANVSPEDPNPSCQDHWTLSTSPMTSYKLYAHNIDQLSSASSILAIKHKIINRGPLVAVINQSVLNQFRNYGSTDGLSFHSFTIIGWENTSNNSIKWKVDDHWPDDSNFCGVGETNSINNSSFLQYLTEGNLKLYSIFSVNTDAPCMDSNPAVFNLSDLNNCPCSFQVPTITDIAYLGEGECLTRNANNSMKAIVDCNGVPAGEYQWVVSPGGAGSHSTFDCHSYNIVIPTIESVFIKVRARQSAECPWSPWYEEMFCTRGGGGDGPEANGIPIRY